MALTRAKKEIVIAEVDELLKNTKMTVVANYKGTSVKELQDLRKIARENGTKVKVIKNRLFKQALSKSDQYKNVDTSELNRQLLYAFNSDDEVAPAQSLAKFAKSAPSLKFVGALTDEGKFIDASDVEALSRLPSKHQLIAELISTLNSPVNGVISGIGGGLSDILNGLEAKAA